MQSPENNYFSGLSRQISSQSFSEMALQHLEDRRLWIEELSAEHRIRDNAFVPISLQSTFTNAEHRANFLACQIDFVKNRGALFFDKAFDQPQGLSEFFAQFPEFFRRARNQIICHRRTGIKLLIRIRCISSSLKNILFPKAV